MLVGAAIAETAEVTAGACCTASAAAAAGTGVDAGAMPLAFGFGLFATQHCCLSFPFVFALALLFASILIRFASAGLFVVAGIGFRVATG